MISAVTFDCWQTLITEANHSAAMKSRSAALSRLGGIDLERAAQLINTAWQSHLKRWEKGVQCGAREIAADCSRACDVDSSDLDELTRVFEDAALGNAVEALPGALDTLKLVRAAGHRTALVCDTGFTPGRVVRQLLDSLGLAEHLEALIFSDEIGVPKPSPLMFGAALGAIQARPDESIHVGDIRRTDIVGAKSFGMKAVRIAATNDDTTEFVEADEVVVSHFELPDALIRLGANL